MWWEYENPKSVLNIQCHYRQIFDFGVNFHQNKKCQKYNIVTGYFIYKRINKQFKDLLVDVQSFIS